MTTSLKWERTVNGYRHGDYEARASAGGYRLFYHGSFVFGAPTLREVETHLLGRLRDKAKKGAK